MGISHDVLKDIFCALPHQANKATNLCLHACIPRPSSICEWHLNLNTFEIHNVSISILFLTAGEFLRVVFMYLVIPTQNK